ASRATTDSQHRAPQVPRSANKTTAAQSPRSPHKSKPTQADPGQKPTREIGIPPTPTALPPPTPQVDSATRSAPHNPGNGPAAQSNSPAAHSPTRPASACNPGSANVA